MPAGARIARDAFGIPHLSARDERDMVFLQGYVHAQDRLFQMDVTRRQAEGTLAELLGSGALASDVQLRTFGLRRAAERSLPLLSNATRDALAAYADGVNAYVARHPLPPEYAALEITRVRPWSPADSVAVIKLIGFGLSFELTDVDRTALLSRYQVAGDGAGIQRLVTLLRGRPSSCAIQRCGDGPGRKHTCRGRLRRDAVVGCSDATR